LCLLLRLPVGFCYGRSCWRLLQCPPDAVRSSKGRAARKGPRFRTGAPSLTLQPLTVSGYLIMSSSSAPGGAPRPRRLPPECHDPRGLLPEAVRAAQPAPLLDLPFPYLAGDCADPCDHHVRLTEERCALMLRKIGWVFVAGTCNKAPELIRPRRLDHLGGL